MFNVTTRYLAYKKWILGILFCLIFLGVFLNSTPVWVLGSILSKYSEHKLALYETKGTFWSGSGLLVAVDPKTKNTAPLIQLGWKIEPGLKRLIDIKFLAGSSEVAHVYLDKHGLTVDSLNLSLSIAQVTELFGIIKNLGLSGNINILANQVYLGKVNQGKFNINLVAVSSDLSPVNPLGDYNVDFDINTGKFQVNSNGNSALALTGSGSLSSLILNGKIAPSEKNKLVQFISIMGLPQPDGSYQLKIF